tara:strand:- start:115 stop:312 length:198 start_codon:yes stop_codon:yes gene_type:complete
LNRRGFKGFSWKNTVLLEQTVRYFGKPPGLFYTRSFLEVSLQSAEGLFTYLPFSPGGPKTGVENV